jgi:predicted transcriptional regulator
VSKRKLPALHFYPGDWKRDVAVRALDPIDRYVWFEILLLMHDAEERGILAIAGVPMTPSEIANAIGIDRKTVEKSLKNITAKGVASVREDGALFNRRMIREQEISEVRSVAGSSGGKKRASKTQANVWQNTEDENDNEVGIKNLKRIVTTTATVTLRPPEPLKPPSETLDDPDDPWLPQALEQLEPPDPTANPYITTGRQRMKKYPRIWLTVGEFCDVCRQLEEAEIPPDKFHLVFKKCAARLKERDVDKAYSWLIGWAKQSTMEELKASLDLQRSKNYLAKSLQ